jgi:predicted small integral membrane protein
VTAFFGSYITIIGGVIVFDKFPETIIKKKTIRENIIEYLPYIVAIILLAILGIFIQRKTFLDKQ